MNDSHSPLLISNIYKSVVFDAFLFINYEDLGKSTIPSTVVGDMAKTRYEELRRSIIMYDSENHEGVNNDEHTLHVTTYNILGLIFKEFENFDWTELLSFDVEFEHVVNIRFEQIAKEEKDDLKNVVALRMYVGWSLITKCSEIQSEHALAKPRDMIEERLAKFVEYCIKHIVEPCMGEPGTRSS